jgi:hypothetical protein
MRSVDLAVYADSIAAEAAALCARLERARRRLRQAAIEREARLALPADAVRRLEQLDLLRPSHAGEELRRSPSFSRRSRPSSGSRRGSTSASKPRCAVSR